VNCGEHLITLKNSTIISAANVHWPLVHEAKESAMHAQRLKIQVSAAGKIAAEAFVICLSLLE
jgi:hypothetical protein